jgi:hypothetical protein
MASFNGSISVNKFFLLDFFKFLDFSQVSVFLGHPVHNFPAAGVASNTMSIWGTFTRLRLACRRLWSLQLFRMWRRVVWLKFTDVPEKITAIFRYLLLCIHSASTVSSSLECENPENAGSRSLQNDGKFLSHCIDSRVLSRTPFLPATHFLRRLYYGIISWHSRFRNPGTVSRWIH